jgi:hypothetical protein
MGPGTGTPNWVPTPMIAPDPDDRSQFRHSLESPSQDWGVGSNGTGNRNKPPAAHQREMIEIL